jgi:hypothetical protein
VVGANAAEAMRALEAKVARCVVWRAWEGGMADSAVVLADA